MIIKTHTIETLKKYNGEKQLFFDESKNKIIQKYDITNQSDCSKIYPILRTALEVASDIPFTKGHTSKKVAKSLILISAGAYPSKNSHTGFESFDGLPCKTFTQVESHLKRTKEEISLLVMPHLINVYKASIKFLSKRKQSDFEDELILSLAEMCKKVENITNKR